MLKIAATKLSQIICTRISHDLIGNIGAVSNAVELLEEGDMDFMDDIKSILQVSSEVLSSRLKFFRMAYGLDNSNISNQDMIKEVSEKYLKSIGNQKDYPVKLNMSLQNADSYGRMSMLGIMVMSDIIIKGGEITVSAADKLKIRLVSPNALSSERKMNILSINQGTLPENLAQYAPMICLQTIAEEKGKNIQFRETEGIELIIE